MGNKTLVVIILLAVVTLSVFLVFSSSNNTTGNIVNVGTGDIEFQNKCESDYILDIVNEEYKDVQINHDCPHITGGIRTGNVGLLINVENQNNIALSIPCYIEISRTNFDTEPPTQYDYTKIKDFTINLNPKSSKVIKEMFHMPECYGSYVIECEDVERLPECSN